MLQPNSEPTLLFHGLSPEPLESGTFVLPSTLPSASPLVFCPTFSPPFFVSAPWRRFSQLSPEVHIGCHTPMPAIPSSQPRRPIGEIDNNPSHGLEKPYTLSYLSPGWNYHNGIPPTACFLMYTCLVTPETRKKRCRFPFSRYTTTKPSVNPSR